MMNTSPPTKAKFILSDDIREETGGKMTIAGLYADDRIYLNPAGPSTLPPGIVGILNQLSVACIMFGGSGSFPTVADIIGPSGQVLTHVSGSSDFKSGATNTLALKAANILVPEFGTYTCKISVQRKVFSFKFEILLGPAPALAPSPVHATPSATRAPHARRHK
jgi:hypothetical protein